MVERRITGPVQDPGRPFLAPIAWIDTGSIATTSSETRDATGLTAGINVIYVALVGVSQTAANTELLLQLGDSGGIEESGYSGNISNPITPVTRANGIGFKLTEDTLYDAVTVFDGVVRLLHLGSNIWVCTTNGNDNSTGASWVGGGTKTLSAELTQFRLTTEAGTATFDLGTMYWATK